MPRANRTVAGKPTSEIALWMDGRLWTTPRAEELFRRVGPPRRGARCDIRSVRRNACHIGRRKQSRRKQAYGLLYTRRVPGFHSPDRVAVSVSTVAAVASG